MLKDCIVTKRKITYEGGEFEVRGLSLPDVAGFIVNHREAVDRVAAIIRVQQQLNLDDSTTAIDVAIDVIKESPYLCADVICSCADEPEEYTSAFRLPLTIQIEALRVIGELTFADAAAVKKLMADAKALLIGILPPTVEAAAA